LIVVGIFLDLVLALFYLTYGLVVWFFSGIGLFFIGAAVVGLLVLLLVYRFTYVRIRNGDYRAARLPTLAWAIILFVTLSIVSAVLFLIAYVKLGEAVRELESPPWITSPASGVPPIK
jgi:hypothetical protein